MNDFHKIESKKSSKDNINISKKPSLKRNSAPRLKNLGQFILGDKIGEGTFGIVRLATHILTGEKVAIKILDKRKITEDVDKEHVEREIKILKMLRHTNIVHLFYVIQNSTSISLIMEYSSGKDLFDYLAAKKRLSEMEACGLFQQLISGLDYLHKLKVAHRDLKPENLLLDHEHKNIKLVDFGLSNIYHSNELLSTSCGSPSYAAPEMLNSKEYDGSKVDIWSSGIILFAMICGYLPFEDKDKDNLYKKIQAGVFSIPSFVSEQARDLIQRILVTDPTKRMTIHHIKNHPWFNLINPKINVNEGLLIKVVVIPIDEDLVTKMEEFSYKKEVVRANVLANKLNHITTTYYLLLQEKIRKGIPSVADLKSSEFITYINDQCNLLKSYHYNLEEVIKSRAFIKEEKKDKTEEKKTHSNEPHKPQKEEEANNDELNTTTFLPTNTKKIPNKPKKRESNKDIKPHQITVDTNEQLYIKPKRLKSSNTPMNLHLKSIHSPSNNITKTNYNITNQYKKQTRLKRSFHITKTDQKSLITLSTNQTKRHQYSKTAIEYKHSMNEHINVNKVIKPHTTKERKKVFSNVKCVEIKLDTKKEKKNKKNPCNNISPMPIKINIKDKNQNNVVNHI